MGSGGRFYSHPQIFDQPNGAQRSREAHAGPALGGGAAKTPTQTTAEPRARVLSQELSLSPRTQLAGGARLCPLGSLPGVRLN